MNTACNNLSEDSCRFLHKRSELIWIKETFFKIEMTDIKTVLYCAVSLLNLYFGNENYDWGSITGGEYNIHEKYFSVRCLEFVGNPKTERKDIKSEEELENKKKNRLIFQNEDTGCYFKIKAIVFTLKRRHSKLLENEDMICAQRKSRREKMCGSTEYLKSVLRYSVLSDKPECNFLCCLLFFLKKLKSISTC